MHEPTLEQIGDYNGLHGMKKVVVRTVVITGILIGAIYTIVANSYVGQVHDALPVKDGIAAFPFDK